MTDMGIRARRLADFCEAYGVSRAKAWEEIRMGRLKALKNGRYVIITEEAASEWLARLPQVTPKEAA